MVFSIFICLYSLIVFFFFFSFLRFCLEDTLKALKEKAKQSEAPEPEPEPTTEVLFLCSYEGCGKTFIDAGALRKHSHIHGERQYVCHYEGCGKVLFCVLFSFVRIELRNFCKIPWPQHGIQLGLLLLWSTND